jgi:hypothetical protein
MLDAGRPDELLLHGGLVLEPYTFAPLPPLYGRDDPARVAAAWIAANNVRPDDAPLVVSRIMQAVADARAARAAAAAEVGPLAAWLARDGNWLAVLAVCALYAQLHQRRQAAAARAARGRSRPEAGAEMETEHVADGATTASKSGAAAAPAAACVTPSASPYQDPSAGLGLNGGCVQPESEPGSGGGSNASRTGAGRSEIPAGLIWPAGCEKAVASVVALATSVRSFVPPTAVRATAAVASGWSKHVRPYLARHFGPKLDAFLHGDRVAA